MSKARRTRSQSYQDLQDAITRYLLSRKGVTLRELVEALEEDYWTLWGALCALRHRGTVYPLINKGMGSGRPGGPPIKYRLSRAAQRRVDRRNR